MRTGLGSGRRSGVRSRIRRHEVGLGEAALKGAVAGVAGSVAMMAAHELEVRGMFAGERRPEPAIRRGVRRAARKEGVRLSSRQKLGAEIGVQLVGAAVVGALFGVVQSRLRLPATANAALLGGLVYATGHSGLLPRAGLFAPPANQTLKEALVPAGSNAVFGLATARVFAMLTR